MPSESTKLSNPIWLRGELSRVRTELDRANRPWSVRLTVPDDVDIFRHVECKLVDTGHSDRVLIVSCEELIAERDAALARAEKAERAEADLRDSMGAAFKTYGLAAGPEAVNALAMRAEKAEARAERLAAECRAWRRWKERARTAGEDPRERWNQINVYRAAVDAHGDMKGGAA